MTIELLDAEKAIFLHYFDPPDKPAAEAAIDTLRAASITAGFQDPVIAIDHDDGPSLRAFVTGGVLVWAPDTGYIYHRFTNSPPHDDDTE